MLTTNQFFYFFFGLKLMVVEAQIPNSDLTLKQLLRRVTLTVNFMKVWIASFIIYQMFKWISSIVTVLASNNFEFASLIIWSSLFALFNLLQIPLWIYFWGMAYRFLNYLELDLTWPTVKKICLGIFFSL